MQVMVSEKTIYQFFQYNAISIIKLLKNRVANKPFFLSYDNMNFYEKIKK